MNTVTTPLIDEASSELFTKFAEMEMSNITEGSKLDFMNGNYFIKLGKDVCDSEKFKNWLHAGFIHFLTKAILSHNPREIEELHAVRVLTGFALGFKYAQYLQDQRELKSIK